MAQPNSSDLILVNRDGVDYQTTYAEAFPNKDLPLIPGPPVIALNGQPQTAPAEPDDPIVIIRNGEGPESPTNQWQRGLDGLWNDIVGETGVDYTVTLADVAVNIRLKQTFSDGSELYSNEIIVTDTIPLPWEDWTGGIWHIKNASVTFKLTKGPYVAWNIDGTNQREIEKVAVGEELVFITEPSAEFLFKNSTGNWDFGDLTDTSNVTIMRSMFSSALAFNSDISNWDVSNVTDMFELFNNAQAFNSDISGWDTSNVKDMSNMFFNAIKFNTDISGWDMSNVTNMRNMLRKAEVFNSDVSNWNTSNVTDMSSVFQGTPAFNSDIGGWDVSNVTEMSNMLRNSHLFNSDISNWDVGNVTNMNYMFKELPIFNQDISNWEVGNVTNMVNMFWNARTFNQDLTSWCVSKIKRQPENFKTNSAMPKDGRYDPKWGTCPPRQVTTLNYTVTVANTGYGNKYYLDGNEQQSIDVIVGDTIVFDQSDSTNTGHPLRVYTDEARTTEYTTGVTVNGTTITFVVSESGTFYYQCQAHAGMGSNITVS